MTPWEEYLLMTREEQRAVQFHLLMGLLRGEVEARLLTLALSCCGVYWSEESGTFVYRGS